MGTIVVSLGIAVMFIIWVWKYVEDDEVSYRVEQKETYKIKKRY